MTTIHMPSHAMCTAILKSRLSTRYYFDTYGAKPLDERETCVAAAVVRHGVAPTTGPTHVHRIMRRALADMTIGANLNPINRQQYRELFNQSRQDLLDGCAPLLVLERLFTATCVSLTYTEKLRKTETAAGQVCVDVIKTCLPGGMYLDIDDATPRYPEWVVD